MTARRAERLLGLAAGACAAAALAGCSAYDTRYRYEPRPLEFGHVLAGDADRSASTLVTIVGVRKRDAEADVPASVEVRLRVDNHGDEEVRLDPATLRLFAANLEPFPPPAGAPAPLVVAPGDTGMLTVYLPFPDGKVPGAYDLDGLSVRWTLDVGGEPSTGNATFVRSDRDSGGFYPVGFFGFSTFFYDGPYYSRYPYGYRGYRGHGWWPGRGHGRSGGGLRHPGARR